jgi:2-methylcitrate dehydratase PrpD
MGQQTISRTLAKFLVEEIQSARFSPELVAKTKLCVIDSLGCMVGASSRPLAKIMNDYLAGRSQPGPSVLIGGKKRVLPEIAGLANATLAHTLEMDDGHRPSDNHIGCVVVPAALAVAESTNASGLQFLEAVVAGYEIMGRVGEAVVLPRMMTPYHGTGTCGPFGAFGSAAKLWGLTVEQVVMGMGIAGTQAGGLREVFTTGTDCKPLHAGKSAHSGLLAAELARRGWQGPEAVIEGENGFCVAMTPKYSLARIDKELGTRWAVLETGFKIHGTCGLLFCIIDGTLDFLKVGRSTVGEIEKIEVALPEWITKDPAFSRKYPTTSGQARFSVPYAVAVTLTDGKAKEAQFDESRLGDPSLSKLQEMVTLHTDPEITDIFERTKEIPFFFYPTKIKITRRGGGPVWEKIITHPMGYDPGTPLTPEEVRDKFISMGEAVLGLKHCEEVLEVANRLETVTDLRALTNLIA